MKDTLLAIFDFLVILAVIRMWRITHELKKEIKELRADQDDEDDGSGDNPQGKGPKTPFGIDESDPGDWWKR